MVETETFASLALIAQLLSLIFKTLYSNKEISPRELISYLDAVVKGLEKSWISEGDLDPDVIASQVLRLAAEVGQLASARHTINVNGVDHTMYINYGTIIPLLVLAAALGALGYVYMWWKGLSVSDLMYVTKSNMENAISILTKHLEHVSEALAATKRHLTQRIENLDGKLDDLLKILKLIKTEVTGVRGDLSQIGYNFDALKRIVSGVDEKICSLADKQDLANRGVLYLCNFVNRGEEEMPEVLQEQLKLSGKSRGCLTASGTSSLKEQLKLSGKSRGCLTASGTSSLKGLKEIADWLETGNASRSITDYFLPRLY